MPTNVDMSSEIALFKKLPSHVFYKSNRTLVDHPIVPGQQFYASRSGSSVISGQFCYVIHSHLWGGLWEPTHVTRDDVKESFHFTGIPKNLACALLRQVGKCSEGKFLDYNLQQYKYQCKYIKFQNKTGHCLSERDFSGGVLKKVCL